jgi:Apea-like HEPN
MNPFEMLASEFLTDAVEELIRQQALPLRPNRPHVSVGDDYEGPPIMALGAFKAFSAFLSESYPERFASRRDREQQEFTNSYIFNFLESAINLSFDASSREILNKNSVASVMAELRDVLEDGLVEIRAMRFLSNVTCSEPEINFGGITLMAASEGTFERNSLAVRQIPGAARLLSENRRFVFDPPHSWLTKSQKTSTDTVESTRLVLARELSHYQTALCLYSGATINPHFEISGATTMFSPSHVQVDDFLIAPMGNIMKRGLKVHKDDIKPVSEIANWLASSSQAADGVIATPISIAISKFNGASSFSSGFERIIDLMTALEALLLNDDETESIGLRLRTRAAILLSTENDNAATIAKDLGALYSVRSILVHGSSLKQPKLARALAKVSSVEGQPDFSGRFGIQLDLAADRLRDLTRRGILMRLALNMAPSSPWTFEITPHLDELSYEPELGVTLNTLWRSTMGDIGAANSLLEAPPAQLFLSD